MGEKIKVLFYILPINHPYDEAKKFLLKEDYLNAVIIQYSDALWKEKNIETFKIEYNLAITEAGYVFAFPEDKLVEIKNPTPV
jgi:hypothetical protein